MQRFVAFISLSASLNLLATTAKQTTPQNSSREFYLKTEVVNPEYDQPYYHSKDARYISSFHTGAGTTDAILTKDQSLAAKAYLNGTTLGFDLGTEFPWGFVMATDTNYVDWQSVMINAGKETSGFYIVEPNGDEYTGLMWNADYPNPVTTSNPFYCWLACDWYHGVPQLFWLVHNGISGDNASLIDTCNMVQLVPVYVDTVANASQF